MEGFTNMFLFFPVFFTFISFACKKNDYKKFDDSLKKITKFKGGRLETHKGFKILVLNGSHYDMGSQYAHFLKDEYLKNRVAWNSFCENILKIKEKELKETWEKISPNIPSEYIQEMQGRADALSLSLNDVGLIDTIGLFASKIIGCSNMAAWGPATIDSELYHLRSQDYSTQIISNKETGESAYENSLIVVRRPDKGFTSIYPHSPGEVGVEGGFNEKSICLGWSDSPCKDQTIDGIPIIIRQLMVLDRASNIEKSIKILDSKRNISCNIIVSDGKKPEAVILEQSANNSYIGHWNDPLESKGRYRQISHAVRRTNFFLNKALADTQKGLYNQKNFYWPFVAIYRHYVALSKGINQNWGKLNLNSTMSMIRSLYIGEIDFLYKLGVKIIQKKTFNQWVACPKTGDLLFSFARNKKNAYESPVFYVNLYKLLNQER